MTKTSWAPLLIIVVLAGVTVWGLRQYAAPAGRAAGGARPALKFFRDAAPVRALTMRDLDGRELASGGWKGKVTLVNFWATWCGPCREEIPALVALQEKYRDRLQIIGVSEDEVSPDRVREFAARYHINYPVVMLTREIEEAFPGVFALPTTFVIDHELRVVQKHTGMLNPDLTELETRALAGLDVDARIEQMDRAQPAKLENGAQLTNIPGIDLSMLPAERRAAALQKLNTDGCTCGCDLTLAKCRIDDPNCGVSLPLARTIVEQIAKQ